MEKVDLKDFERRVIVRPLQTADFEAVAELQSKCFPGMTGWSRDQFLSQLATFPEGQIGVEVDGRLVASSSSLVVDYDPHLEWHNWEAVADGGLIRNHHRQGDTLYGIEIMVDPEFRGMRLARRLYDARKELCRELNLQRIIIGGRIPGYASQANAMSARAYIENVMNKAVFDPVLTVQLANGFTLQGLIPNYLPGDDASRGYATFLEWRNLDYQPVKKRRYHHLVEMVRLCVVQYQMRKIAGFDEFAQQCEFFLDTASDYKSDFILFPELLTTQLLSCVEPSPSGMAARRLAEFTPQYLEFFTEMAIKYDVNVVAGSHFVIEDDKLYNVAYLFGRNGAIGKQYKLHITPSERRWWGVSPGRTIDIFETDCGPICIQICYDIEFPELTRIVAQKGAQLVFVPFNTDARHGYLRVRNCALARCIENHVYVAISGCTGNLPFVENADIHYAQSGIFTPSDVEFARDCIAAECNPNVETVIIHDIDLALLRRHRERGATQNWHDRRRDLYRVVYNDLTGEHHV